MKDSLPTASWKELLLWLLRRRQRYRVAGASMEPLLHEGDVVLLDPRAYGQLSPQVDELVVAFHPQRDGYRIIKRIESFCDGAIFLASDNKAQGSDSGDFGTVRVESIIGRVTSRISL